MTTEGIQLFQLLKTRLGSREAEGLVNYMDSTLKENNKEIQEANLKTLATKEDLAKVEVKVAEVKSDIIRWMFALFVTMMLAILGLYLKH